MPVLSVQLNNPITLPTPWETIYSEMRHLAAQVANPVSPVFPEVSGTQIHDSLQDVLPPPIPVDNAFYDSQQPINEYFTEEFQDAQEKENEPPLKKRKPRRSRMAHSTNLHRRMSL
ncbi:hypothetical protein GE061_018397 [Apolygus lucorum]|uniref:Uncharacterized protein n=1 Tax=Apolygus lucorum TaxID=248454 RepID=A0A8S9XFW2_APOLU|nr:hypothetical protein GE061_018397 [Apolygus lucorum]